MSAISIDRSTVPASQPLTSPKGGPKADGVSLTELSSTHRKQWEDTMSMMVWTCPGMQHLFYRMLNGQNNTSSEYTALMTRDTPVAATDGQNILINPDNFFNYKLPGRVFIMAHEVGHNALGDVELLHRCRITGLVPQTDGGKPLPFDFDTMHKAMDARVNAWLKESNIGIPPENGFYDDKVSGADSVLDIYKRYYKHKKTDDNDGDLNPDKNHSGFDDIMAPGGATGQDPGKAAEQRNPDKWAVEIASARTIENIRHNGKMSGAMARFFKDILEPEVPWTDHIETLINRVVGDGGYDYTTPDPYFGGANGDQYFIPAPTGYGAGWIVMWGDTSGSRNDQEIASQISETKGIMEAVNPARLTIIWADAAIQGIEEIIDIADLDYLKPKGGGGTDYGPVRDWIKNNPDGLPDLFIGFTDGYVDFPSVEHPYPTIWASSTDEVYPFGDVVRVNKVQRT